MQALGPGVSCPQCRSLAALTHEQLRIPGGGVSAVAPAEGLGLRSLKRATVSSSDSPSFATKGGLESFTQEIACCATTVGAASPSSSYVNYSGRGIGITTGSLAGGRAYDLSGEEVATSPESIFLNDAAQLPREEPPTVELLEPSRGMQSLFDSLVAETQSLWVRALLC